MMHYSIVTMPISLLSTHRLLLNDAAGLVRGAGPVQPLDLGDVVPRQVYGDVPGGCLHAGVCIKAVKSATHPL